ncbi:MAG: hypothetical protein GY754_22495 [bacterium]|nr:hypothetical protein [bacterium]
MLLVIFLLNCTQKPFSTVVDDEVFIKRIEKFYNNKLKEKGSSILIKDNIEDSINYEFKNGSFLLSNYEDHETAGYYDEFDYKNFKIRQQISRGYDCAIITLRTWVITKKYSMELMGIIKPKDPKEKCGQKILDDSYYLKYAEPEKESIIFLKSLIDYFESEIKF